MTPKFPIDRTRLSRRSFLQVFFAPGRSERECVLEEPQIPGRFRLNSLKLLPDSVLRPIIPVLRDGLTAEPCDRGVAYKTREGGAGIVLLSPGSRMAANLFDGRRTLEDVVQVLAQDQSMPADTAWQMVREAFLALAEQLVYQPAAPPQLTPDGTPPGGTAP